MPSQNENIIPGIVENNLSYIQMADKVLEWFCMDINSVLSEGINAIDRKNRLFVSQHNAGVAIIDHFIKNRRKELNSVEFTWVFPLIMDKLVADSYISYSNVNHTYSQNLNGIIFWENGGYKGESIRNRQVEIRNHNSYILNCILAFGVTAPFLWYSFDLIQKYFPSWIDLSVVLLLLLIGGVIGISTVLVVQQIDRRK